MFKKQYASFISLYLLYRYQQSHRGPLWYLQKVLIWSWGFNTPEDRDTARVGKRETD